MIGFEARLGHKLALALLAIAVGTAFSACAAYDPQGAAQQAAPNYYNSQYSSLSAQEKMQLEDHLANQSNQAWRTTASVMSGMGRLAGGTGLLLWGIRR